MKNKWNTRSCCCAKAIPAPANSSLLLISAMLFLPSLMFYLFSFLW